MFDNDINFLPEELREKEKKERKKAPPGYKKIPMTEPIRLDSRQFQEGSLGAIPAIIKAEKTSPAKLGQTDRPKPSEADAKAKEDNIPKIKFKKIKPPKKRGWFLLNIFKRKKHQEKIFPINKIDSKYKSDLLPKISPIKKPTTINLTEGVISRPRLEIPTEVKDEKPEKKLLFGGPEIKEEKQRKKEFLTSPTPKVREQLKEADVNLVPDEFVINLRFKQRLLILGIGIIFVFIAIGLAFLGIKIYTNPFTGGYYSINNQLTELKEKIKSYEEYRLQSKMLSQKINLVFELIKKHPYWSKFFNVLEKNTYADVTYSNFMGSVDGQISLEAATTDFEALAQQILILQNSELIESLDFSGASSLLSENLGENKVSFDLILKFKPEVFLEEN